MSKCQNVQYTALHTLYGCCNSSYLTLPGYSVFTDPHFCRLTARDNAPIPHTTLEFVSEWLVWSFTSPVHLASVAVKDSDIPCLGNQERIRSSRWFFPHCSHSASTDQLSWCHQQSEKVTFARWPSLISGWGDHVSWSVIGEHWQHYFAVIG